MNKKQRKELEKIRSRIDSSCCELNEIYEEIVMIRDEEEEKYENLSEGLQCSELGEKLIEVSEQLDNIASEVEDCVSSLESIVMDIDEVL